MNVQQMVLRFPVFGVGFGEMGLERKLRSSSLFSRICARQVKATCLQNAVCLAAFVATPSEFTWLQNALGTIYARIP
jgi:hypothetical protein